jgi:hypothetical protein
MKRTSLLVVLLSALSVTAAFAARMEPAHVKGSSDVDVCSGNDCSDTGIFEAAKRVCIQNDLGTRADHWAIVARSVQGEHWNGSGWENVPTTVVFKWVECS